MSQYDGHYDIQDRLAQEARILPAPLLYPFDDRAVYAAILDRLAQDLPDGRPSPFSSRNPNSAESQMVGAIVHLQSLVAHELNLLPDLAWIQLYRMLGVQVLPSEYPVVTVTFVKSDNALTAYIPAGFEVRSRRDPTLVAVTLEDRRIVSPETQLAIPCRLSQAGVIGTLQRGELSVIPDLAIGIASAYNDGTILSRGREEESLPQAMTRARLQFQRGLRCVTEPDFYNSAIELGALKANVLAGIVPNVDGQFGDLVTLIVYPPEMVGGIDAGIRPYILLGQRFQCYGAEVVPIDGYIEVRGNTALSDAQARDLAASAILSYCNPPHGVWGDRDYARTVATAIENEPGIYAVPTIALKHAETGVPLDDLDIQPWQLLEIQSSTTIVAV